MRLLALLAIPGSMTLLGACSSSTTHQGEATGGTGTGGAGAGGAATGGASTGGAGGASDAGTDADAGGMCPGGMVALPGGFCIDATEVTNQAYDAWITSGASLGPPCEWKTDLHPSTQGVCADRNKAPTGPVACVDWCDAFAYCKDHKKHLCGQRDGGAVAPANHDDPQVDEWHWACSNGGKTEYPYGATYAATKCAVGPGLPLNTKLKTECYGESFAQLFDMSGNVAEWVNSCEKSATDESSPCLVRGGSTGLASPVPETFSCAGTPGPDGGESGDLKPRNTVSPLIGFRCCWDPDVDPAP